LGRDPHDLLDHKGLILDNKGNMKGPRKRAFFQGEGKRVFPKEIKGELNKKVSKKSFADSAEAMPSGGQRTQERKKRKNIRERKGSLIREINKHHGNKTDRGKNGKATEDRRKSESACKRQRDNLKKSFWL